MKHLLLASLLMGLVCCVWGLTGMAKESAIASDCDLAKIEQHAWCATCEQFLTAADLNEEGNCNCGAKPTKVAACVKTFYRCSDCWEESAKAGKCPSCEQEMAVTLSKALIVYVCEGCGNTQNQAGTCQADEEAECFGKALKKTCSESGTFPHEGKGE